MIPEMPTWTGMAVAFDRFEIAILLAILNVFTLYVFGYVKKLSTLKITTSEG